MIRLRCQAGLFDIPIAMLQTTFPALNKVDLSHLFYADWQAAENLSR